VCISLDLSHLGSTKLESIVLDLVFFQNWKIISHYSSKCFLILGSSPLALDSEVPQECWALPQGSVYLFSMSLCSVGRLPFSSPFCYGACPGSACVFASFNSCSASSLRLQTFAFIPRACPDFRENFYITTPERLYCLTIPVSVSSLSAALSLLLQTSLIFCMKSDLGLCPERFECRVTRLGRSDLTECWLAFSVSRQLDPRCSVDQWGGAPGSTWAQFFKTVVFGPRG
jgi:hypothetical protein